MARGGYRPNSGPKKGTKYRPRGSKKEQKPKIPKDVKQEAADANMMPLDYMLKIMRDHKQPADRRDRMAQLAAPFVHPRAGEAKGKKEEKADRAKAAGSGKFAAGRAPLSVVKGGAN
ncbi:MAG: hypothetical protein M0R06_01745 [Sphaerochaeta sp.]|jgi:hypothetical protein|nr:hypothetical protein [Sphaerochaeta sp.]